MPTGPCGGKRRNAACRVHAPGPAAYCGRMSQNENIGAPGPLQGFHCGFSNSPRTSPARTAARSSRIWAPTSSRSSARRRRCRPGVGSAIRRRRRFHLRRGQPWQAERRAGRGDDDGGGAARTDRAQRHPDRGVPPGDVCGAGLRLRDVREWNPRHHLLLRARVRRGRTAAGSAGLRSADAGARRHDVDHGRARHPRPRVGTSVIDMGTGMWLTIACWPRCASGTRRAQALA
jgi:hypothetical protein